MIYNYSTAVKNNDTLRESFNELTRQTFGFDFTGWYEAGHWGDLYLPHVLLDGNKVISNVSVNFMQFDIGGTIKNYIQLGTVMTDSSYRNQGLNREIMECILDKYADKTDGFYLFGNDDVLKYYPKFGFKPSKEYEYYMPYENNENINSYAIEKIDISNQEQCERLYDSIKKYSINPNKPNQNDGMYMSENLGLFQFWIAAGYGDQIYYLPELEIYVIAALNENTLHVHQIFGKEAVDFTHLAKSFGKRINEIVLGYTPARKEQFEVREHKEEDCTLFILGNDLERIVRDKMMFPLLSHA